MSAAQEEVDRLFNQKEKITSHPEDRFASEKGSNSSESDGDESATYVHSDTEPDSSYTMLSRGGGRYHVPKTVYDANTGPKGVIADAQSYERARKRSFRRTLMDAAGFENKTYPSPGKEKERVLQKGVSRAGSQSPDAADEDEEFMRRWREKRMQELEEKGKRRASPHKKKFGTVETVDANGYLDAVEKVVSGTVVVVCIYNHESSESSIVEDCLHTISRKHPATRFIKLHQDIAEMDHIKAPALLAYKNGDVFATIVEIFKQLPNGRGCSSASLEELLIQHRVL